MRQSIIFIGWLTCFLWLSSVQAASITYSLASGRIYFFPDFYGYGFYGGYLPQPHRLRMPRPSYATFKNNNLYFARMAEEKMWLYHNPYADKTPVHPLDNPEFENYEKLYAPELQTPAQITVSPKSISPAQ